MWDNKVDPARLDARIKTKPNFDGRTARFNREATRSAAPIRARAALTTLIFVRLLILKVDLQRLFKFGRRGNPNL